MATRTWPASEAKAHLSELLDAALGGELQVITRRGEEAVVVVSARAYRARNERRGGSLSEFFGRSPHRDVEIAPGRDRRTGRDVKL
jgi:antitoxin Phd